MKRTKWMEFTLMPCCGGQEEKFETPISAPDLAKAFDEGKVIFGLKRRNRIASKGVHINLRAYRYMVIPMGA